MKILRILLELIGWLEITVGCLIAGVLSGAALCQVFSSKERMTVFLVISLTGLLSGAIWASYIWKREGTIEWLSSIRRVS